MLISLFWGCGAVTGAGPTGNGPTGNGPMGERADGGRHGYPPLSYDVTDAVVC